MLGKVVSESGSPIGCLCHGDGGFSEIGDSCCAKAVKAEARSDCGRQNYDNGIGVAGSTSPCPAVI